MNLLGEHAVGRDDADRGRVGLGHARRRTISSSAEFARARWACVTAMTVETIGGRGGCSKTTVTSSPSAAAQRSSSSTSPTIAAWRSRHQPFGRLPMTFIPSMIQRTRLTLAWRAAAAGLRAPASRRGFEPTDAIPGAGEISLGIAVPCFTVIRAMTTAANITLTSNHSTMLGARVVPCWPQAVRDAHTYDAASGV